MARSKQTDERVSAREAAKRLGMTDANVGQWGARPGAPTVLEDGKRLYCWPEFPIWYREQLQATAEPADFEKARARKTQAEAILAEQEVARARGELHAPSVCAPVYAERVDRLRARLLTLSGRGAPRTVGLKSIVESQRVWDQIVEDLMHEMAGGDGRD